MLPNLTIEQRDQATKDFDAWYAEHGDSFADRTSCEAAWQWAYFHYVVKGHAHD